MTVVFNMELSATSQPKNNSQAGPRIFYNSGNPQEVRYDADKEST